jgi:disulfide bond formation protein DsbB
MERLVRLGYTLLIFALMGILSAAYYQQYFKHEMPCPLCLLQRIAMFGVSLGAFMQLRMGIQAKFTSFSLFFAFFGASVSIRQILLHICPGSPIFGIPVYGVNLYTWAFLAFAGAIVALALALFLEPEKKNISHTNLIEWIAGIVIVVLLIANGITTYFECGFNICPDLPWPQDRN